MRFRPCIDIHNGQVKQIVGGSLKDWNDLAEEHFVANQDAAFYAKLYKEAGLKGGHIILLNPVTSEHAEISRNHHGISQAVVFFHFRGKSQHKLVYEP